MLHRSFKPAKCKTALKLASSRLKLLKNKKESQVKQMRRELARLLESGQEQTARIRVEHVIREEKMMTAYDLLELYCELIATRLPIIESQKICPIDLKEAITSVIFASPRCSDVTELEDIRKHFTTKYGKEFISAAVELRPECGVSRLLVEKLSARAPDGQTKIKILKEIAEEHNITWDPTSFEVKELKRPEDLLNGPNTYEKVKKMQAEPPTIHIASCTLPAHQSHDQKYEASANSNYNLSASASPATSTPTWIHGDQTTPAASDHVFGPSGAESERMEVRRHSGDGNASSPIGRNWNMEFENATAAAQAAAESAEQASMAARAAAKLASREKIARQYSKESEQSDYNGPRNEEPREDDTGMKLQGKHYDKDSENCSSHDRNQQIDGNRHYNSAEVGEEFYRSGPGKKETPSSSDSLRSYTGSFDKKFAEDFQEAGKHSQKSSTKEDSMKAEKSSFRAQLSMKKQSGGSEVESVSGRQSRFQTKHFDCFGEGRIKKQGSRASSRSHSSTHGDDNDIVNSSHQKFKIDTGQGHSVSMDRGKVYTVTSLTSSNDNASAVFDESGSDDDGCRFEMGTKDESLKERSSRSTEPYNGLAATFDDSEHSSLDSGDEMGKSSIPPHKPNVCLQNPPQAQDEIDGFRRSSVTGKGDLKSSRRKHGQYSFSVSESMNMASDNKQQAELTARSDRKIGSDQLLTHQSLSRRSKMEVVFSNDAKSRQALQSSKMKIEDFLESGQGLHFSTSTGGLKNKGSIGSGASKEQSDRSRLGAPVTAYVSGSDDSDEESPKQGSSRRTESFNHNKAKVYTKTRLQDKASYSDSDDSASGEDRQRQAFASTSHGGSSFFTSTKANLNSEASSYTKVRCDPESRVDSEVGTERMSSTSSFGSKLQTQKVSSDHHRSEPSRPRRGPSKSIPESKALPKESPKTSEMAKASSPKKIVASGSSEGPKKSTGEAPSRESSLKKAGHVHPKLPNYDTLAAQFQALRMNRQ